MNENIKDSYIGAELINKQSDRMEHIDAIEWLKQMNIEVKKDIFSQIKPNIL